MTFCRLLATLISLLTMTSHSLATPLASWRQTPTKEAIIDFVQRVTTQDSPDFVPVAERIAVFDNDGTLWAEQPMYGQFFFVLDRLKALSAKHHEWRVQQPFAKLIRGNWQTLMAADRATLEKVLMTTQSGMTTSDFYHLVKRWIASAKNPLTKQRFTAMTYQPMRELLTYLKAHQFKVFIVTGGGIDFVRAWAPAVYGIPPERIIGSSLKTEYRIKQQHPSLMRLPQVAFITDNAGKAKSISRRIGRKPIIAFGNSDGDQQMLEWTQSCRGPCLMALVHHDDAKREWAYGAQSKIGRFSDALMAEAKKQHWIVVSMKKDWQRIFRHPKPKTTTE